MEKKIIERKNKVTFKNKAVTLLGQELRAGDKAPDFTVLDRTLREVTLKEFKGGIKLISCTPSLDTSVCSTQARTFNERAAALSKDVSVINISMDLPFAIDRFCSTAGIERVTALSDHRYASFGEAYGVLVKELRLLARAVFVVDRFDTITYMEIVPEATNSVNFDRALEEVGRLIARGKAA